MAKRVFEIPDLPGGELLERAAEVTGLELAVLADALGGDLDSYDSLDAVAVWGRVASWAQARQAEAAATVEGHVTELYGPGEGARPAATSDGPGHTQSRRSVEPRASREVAMRLGLTRPAAAALIKTGRAITGPMTATGEALAQGQLCWAKARAIVGGLDGLPEPLVMDVEDSLLPDASGRTPAQLRRDVAKLVIAADPEGAVERHQVARAARRVNRPSPLPDGMARISAVLAAEDALALDLCLDGAARHARSGSDGRTTDQLRADALAAVGHHALVSGRVELPGTQGEPSRARAGTSTSQPESPEAGAEAPGTHTATAGAKAGIANAGPGAQDSTEDSTEHHTEDSTGTDTRAPYAFPTGTGSAPYAFPTGTGSAPRIHVTVPLSALLAHQLGNHNGNDENDQWNIDGRDSPPDLGEIRDLRTAPDLDAVPDLGAVPELHGYGAIDPLTARALSAGGIWRRLVSTPGSGTVLDVGRTVYRPPADLARFVRTRDGTCTRPGCTVKAEACELDHIQPWEHGGSTSAANLTPLCPSDHRAKSRGEFRVTRQDDGALDWTSPTGHTYRRTPTGSVVHLGRDDHSATSHESDAPPY